MTIVFQLVSSKGHASWPLGSEAIIKCSSNFPSLEVNVIIDFIARLRGATTCLSYAISRTTTITKTRHTSLQDLLSYAWLCNLLHLLFMDCDSVEALLLCPPQIWWMQKKRQRRGSRDWATFGGLSTLGPVCAVSCDFDPVLCEASDVYIKKSIIQLTRRVKLSKWVAEGAKWSLQKWQQTVKTASPKNICINVARVHWKWNSLTFRMHKFSIPLPFYGY